MLLESILQFCCLQQLFALEACLSFIQVYNFQPSDLKVKLLRKQTVHWHEHHVKVATLPNGEMKYMFDGVVILRDILYSFFETDKKGNSNNQFSHSIDMIIQNRACNQTLELKQEPVIKTPQKCFITIPF